MEYLGIEANGDGGVQPAELVRKLRALPNLASAATSRTVEIKGVHDGPDFENVSMQSGSMSTQPDVDL